ncbi:galactose mutarotase-like domain-containing protein [Aspergillus foveolatus]|uniref:galactose mutarotase-like domain-containing protein n=1 Tax=Aspergillus foveolatus TaxID=210207 RepID=UPI003CCD6E91
MLFRKISPLLSAALVAGLTVTETDDGITVDVEGDDGFVVTIDSTGSISSLQYRDTEYQYSGTLSHIASGLGSDASVSYTTQGLPSLPHQRFAIYMGTNSLSQPAVGELRYIARLVNLPEAYKEGEVSDIRNGEAIEGSDVYLFYSSQRFIDDSVYCAYSTDSSVHACFLSDTRSREKSSGGPFFRDIDLNLVSDYHSVTYYMNSGHVQTEEFRTGFFGPYILSFSGPSIPSWSDFDVSVFDELELDGYVGSSGRGVVTGTVSGTSSSLPAIVHFYNDNYQSWTNASDDGSFTSPELVEGSYTLALYQDELLAATTTVSVTAAATASASISATNPIITADRTTIFQIGTYDGTPSGLRNAENQLRMHPSDSRMADWNPTPFIVDTNSDSDFPMALFKDVNNNFEIQFMLDEVPDTDTITIRIATTLAFASGRPQFTLNDDECDAPEAPTKIDSRGVTRGAYRGYGEVYTCEFDVGSLVAGQNSVYISVVSGSSGEEYLSPNFIVDAIEAYYRV